MDDGCKVVATARRRDGKGASSYMREHVIVHPLLIVHVRVYRIAHVSQPPS